jgi:hypothetical protein
MSSASSDLSTLKSSRKWSNLICCDRIEFAGGLVVSALSGRCILAWRPFCCGSPDLMRSVSTPSGTHQTKSWARRGKVLVAKGTQLSVRMRWGGPYSLNNAVKPVPAPATDVDGKP